MARHEASKVPLIATAVEAIEAGRATGPGVFRPSRAPRSPCWFLTTKLGLVVQFLLVEIFICRVHCVFPY
jgi:hypothetical protein